MFYNTFIFPKLGVEFPDPCNKTVKQKTNILSGKGYVICKRRQEGQDIRASPATPY